MPVPMTIPRKREPDTRESKVPLKDLIVLARQLFPACTSWPERVLSFTSGEPPLPGMWRSRGLPEAYIGWPVLLHAGARPGGAVLPIQALLEVQRWGKLIEGMSYTDLDMDRVKGAARHAHGFMVPYRSLPDGDPSIPYRDELFGQFFIPFAQVWRFQKPVPVAQGGQTWFFVRDAEQRACVQAMKTATRIL